MKQPNRHILTLTAILMICFTTNLNAQICDEDRETEVFASAGFGGGFEIGVFHRRSDWRDDWEDEREPRIHRYPTLRYHGFSLPTCPVYGEEYQEWEEDARIIGIELHRTHPHCAEATFDETFHTYSVAFGPPVQQEHERNFREIERTATWIDGDQVVTVEFFSEPGECTLEVITRYIEDCDDW